MTDATTMPPPPAAADAPEPEKELSLFDQLATRRMSTPVKGAQYGITLSMLADFFNRDDATPDELAAVTPETARQILYERYWRPLMADKLPEPVAAALFDVAVRRGVERAGKLLQKATAEVGPTALSTDGAIGRQTLTAIEALVKDGKAIALAEQVVAHRNTFVWRLWDGKLFGRDFDLAGTLIAVGKAAIAMRTGVKL